MPEDSFRGALIVFCRIAQAALVVFAVMPLAGVVLADGTVLGLLVACIVALTLLAFAGVVQGAVWWIQKGVPEGNE